MFFFNQVTPRKAKKLLYIELKRAHIKKDIQVFIRLTSLNTKYFTSANTGFAGLVKL